MREYLDVKIIADLSCARYFPFRLLFFIDNVFAAAFVVSIMNLGCF